MIVLGEPLGVIEWLGVAVILRRRMPCASARAGRSPLTETDGIAKPMRRLRQLRIRLYECGE